MKKKVLYLSQLYPYPPDGGGKIKTLNTIHALAPHFNIYAIFISEEKPSSFDLKQLTKLGIRVKVFYSSQILASVKDDYPKLFRNFLLGIPHYVFQYTHKPAFPFVLKTINEFQPDIIHVDHLNLSQYLPRIKTIQSHSERSRGIFLNSNKEDPSALRLRRIGRDDGGGKSQIWILEHHNVETYLYWTRFKHSGKLTRKLYLLIEMLLTFIYEWKTLRKFDHIFAISKAEERRVKQMFKVNQVSTQTLPVKQLKLANNKSKQPYILFVGNLGWPPNEDAVEWFLKEILPQVTDEIPNVQFHIVGKRQPMYEKNWPKPSNLFLHGYRKSLNKYLTKAWCFVLPFRMGAGLRLKSLTALSAGLPIVSTPLGMEGLEVENNKNILIANTSAEFANLTIKSLKSNILQKKLSNEALKYINKYHSEKENRKYLDQYMRVISASRITV